MKQLIISIGREFGSGGHEIAEKLSKLYELPLYDHNLLRELAAEKNLDHDSLAEFDETKKSRGLFRTVRGMNSCPAYNVAQLQFEFLKKKADAGESFVVGGRCAETILKDYDGMVSLFILADRQAKVDRITKLYNKTEKEALAMMNTHDKYRKQYHNEHCPGKWGDSRNYELSINSSKLGVDETIKIISAYIDARRQ